MLKTRQLALRHVRKLPAPAQRRWDSSHPPHDSHSSSQNAHHDIPQNESFGTGFYILIGAVGVGYWLHARSIGPQSQETFLSKWIPDFKEEWATRNALHTEAVEQAGTDRALFQGAPSAKNYELRFQDVFNTGSPINRSASNSVDIRGLTDHYKKMNEETAAKIEKKTTEQKFAGRSAGWD